MGITIHYRGKLNDLDQVVEFEDCVLDLVLSLQGRAQIWRTWDDENLDRMVRGVIVNLFPGQEPLSLLISPEGWLTSLMSIEDAEKGLLTEPGYCFCKTQFGPIEGHVAVVELLRALHRRFFSDLEVKDEGEYWESGDFSRLHRLFTQNLSMIHNMGDELRSSALSPEAAEDPEIVKTRIQRVAQLVHQRLARPSRPTEIPGSDEFGDSFSEAACDEMERYQRKRQEEVSRAIAERLRMGESRSEALRKAIIETSPFTSGPDEEYREGVFVDDSAVVHRQDAESAEESEEELDVGTESDEHLKRAGELAGELLLRFGGMGSELPTKREGHSGPANFAEAALESIVAGLVDVTGALAQAGSDYGPLGTGLRVVQLKRALRGAAMAKGATHLLVSAGVIDQERAKSDRDTLKQITAIIMDRLVHYRDAMEAS